MPDWEAVGWVTSSDYRQDVLAQLGEKPATPSGIAHVSRELNELRDRGHVELLVPEETQKGRIYGITDAGRDVLEDIQAWGEA